MKRTAVFVVATLLGLMQLQAQPYTGGKGDGYAMGGVFNLTLSNGQVSHALLDFQVLPNPLRSGDELRLYWRSEQEGKAYVYLYDLTGKVIYKNSYVSSSRQASTTIQLSNLLAGVYLLRVAEGLRTLSSKITLIE